MQQFAEPRATHSVSHGASRDARILGTWLARLCGGECQADGFG